MLCSVHELLRLLPPPPTSSLIKEESPQECYDKLCAADVRLLGLKMHTTDSIHFTLHTCPERERESEGTEGSPMGPSLLVRIKCLQQQLQTQVCVMLGKTCCSTSNHQKPHKISISLRQGTLSLYFCRTCVGFEWFETHLRNCS